MFTYQDYIHHCCSPAEFYSQWVDKYLIIAVASFVGIDEIQSSTCDNFNDIPMSIWTRLYHEIVTNRLASNNASGHIDNVFPSSLLMNVCIYKEAARQLKQLTKSKNDV